MAIAQMGGTCETGIDICRRWVQGGFPDRGMEIPCGKKLDAGYHLRHLCGSH